MLSCTPQAPRLIAMLFQNVWECFLFVADVLEEALLVALDIFMALPWGRVGEQHNEPGRANS